LPSRFHTTSTDAKPSVPEIRLAVLGALGVGKSGMKLSVFDSNEVVLLRYFT